MNKTSLNIVSKAILLYFVIFVFFPNGAESMRRSKRIADLESVKIGDEAGRVRKSRRTAQEEVSTIGVSTEEMDVSASSSASLSSTVVPRDHRFARATLDVAFKHMLLGDEDRSPLLSFLKAFTGIDIMSVTHYPTALPVLRDGSEEKQTFLDLSCRDNKGRYFIVEVQVKEQNYWNPRALYYAAGVYSRQLADGQPWRSLEPVIAINILDHDRETLPDGHFKRDFQLLDREHLGEIRRDVDMEDPVQLPYLRIIQCELPRVNLDSMPICSLRQWLQLLKQSGSLDEIPVGTAEPIKKAYKRLEFSRWGSQLKDSYKAEELHLEDYTNVLTRTRREAKEDVARKMLEENSTSERISRITGLSVDEVEALRVKP